MLSSISPNDRAKIGNKSELSKLFLWYFFKNVLFNTYTLVASESASDSFGRLLRYVSSDAFGSFRLQRQVPSNELHFSPSRRIASPKPTDSESEGVGLSASLRCGNRE